MAREMTAVEERENQAALRSRLAKFEEPVRPFLPDGVTWEQLMWGAMTTALTSPDLYNCTGKSLLTALVQAAQTGLQIGRSVFLVPYKRTATMVVSYQGYVELALATGIVQSVFAHVVREDEQFEVWGGTEPRIVHRITTRGPLAPVVSAYAVATMRGGALVSEVMTRAQIEAIRKGFSQKWGHGELPDWYARKTPVRALAKWLPKSRGLYLALRYDEAGASLLRPEEVDAAMAADAEREPVGEPTLEASVAAGRRPSSRLVLPAGAQVRPLGVREPEVTPRPAAPIPVTTVVGIPKPNAAAMAVARARLTEAAASSAAMPPVSSGPVADLFTRDLPPGLEDEDDDTLPF